MTTRRTALGTLALGEWCSADAARLLDSRCKVPCSILDMPFGLKATAWFACAFYLLAAFLVAIPGAAHATLRDAGHSILLEAPAPLAARIGRTLESLAIACRRALARIPEGWNHAASRRISVVSPSTIEPAPPITPGDARLDSASEATLVPTIDFQVTAPRTGYMMDAPSMAAAEDSLVQASTCTPNSSR